MNRRSRRVGRAAIFAPLLLTATLALGVYRLTPHVGEADTPVSSAALRRHLEAIADKPRPAGSAALADARDYVVGELRTLGYEPQVEASDATVGGRSVALSNIICRLSADAASDGDGLLVACHLDSVPAGPGAGDDAAAVAALLETARLLRDVPGRVRDVVFLVTDGEELGLLGATAWVERHPDRMGCRRLLNFDARGTGGPAVMFETCGRPRRLLDAFFSASPQPATSSVASAVYERMPNGTDLNVFRDAGFDGLNFAFIDGLSNYHTSRDDLAHLSPATALHQAAQMFAVARRAATADDAGAADGGRLIYFDVLSRVVVRYPTTWAWPLAGLAVVTTLIAVVRLRPRPSAVAVGVAKLAAHGVATVGVIFLVTRLPVDKLTHRWTWLALAATVLLSAAGVPWLVGRRPRDRRGWAAAVLVFLAASTLAATAAFGPGSYIPLVPSLAGSLAVLVVSRRPPRHATQAVAAALTTIVVLPLAWLAALALTVKLLVIPAVLVVLVTWTWAASLDPILPRARGGRLAISAGCLLASLTAFAVVYLA